MAAHGVEKRTRKRYSPTEIDTALAVLASTGSSVEASERTGIPASTLRDWKSEHQARYAAIQEREGPRLEAIAAANAREIIIRAGETEHTLLDLLNERITDARRLPPAPEDFTDPDEYHRAYVNWTQRANTKELGDVAGTLQRVTTSKGINGTKLLELTGRPTQIVEHRDPRQAAQALARRLGVTLEATATEINERSLPSASVGANVRDPASTPQSHTAAPD